MNFLPSLTTTALTHHLNWTSNWDHVEQDETLAVSPEKMNEVLNECAERLKNNYPFFHPRYAGQMLKPPHPIAASAYFMTMLINPNNHALDGGPATAKMEFEAVSAIAAMFGYSGHLGHLTSGGTIANLEALWISRSLHPGKAIAFSSESHYTHKRMCNVIGAPYVEIPADDSGTIDCEALETELKKGTIGTVVANIGTTSIGAVDPLHIILPLCRSYGVRIHADAAYGGFFVLLTKRHNAIINPEPFSCLSECDSIVVDPHKHGLQPYGCGCVLFKDASVGKFYKHDSPYTYFTSRELHPGEISLECSRAGAAAAALWCTLRCFPLEAESGLGTVLSKTRQAALTFSSMLSQSDALAEYVRPELDIVTYYPRSTPISASSISHRTRELFSKAMNRLSSPIFLATLAIESTRLRRKVDGFIDDEHTTTILRSVLMKPEHLAFVGRIIEELTALSG